MAQSSAPANKVWAATGGSAFGGAVGTVLNWYLDTNHVLSPSPIPEPVQGAITTIVATALAFGFGWIVRPGQTEEILPDPHDAAQRVSGRTL
jgi:hypothetical protein